MQRLERWLGKVLCAENEILPQTLITLIKESGMHLESQRWGSQDRRILQAP